MDIKLIVITVITTMMLSGCSTTSKPNIKNTYGWKNVNPPRQNVLGKEILKKGIIGDPIYILNSENVEVSLSTEKVTEAQYSNAKAGLELLAQQVAVDLGYEYTKSETLSSSNWKISQIRNLEYILPVDRKFAYQCLTASKYEFTVTSNDGFDATVDATEIARKFGVDTAKVGFKSKPDKPDEFKVAVNDPSVCISYIAAYFEENNGPIINRESEYIDITGPYLFESLSNIGKNSYELKSGETSY